MFSLSLSPAAEGTEPAEGGLTLVEFGSHTGDRLLHLNSASRHHQKAEAGRSGMERELFPSGNVRYWEAEGVAQRTAGVQVMSHSGDRS